MDNRIKELTQQVADLTRQLNHEKAIVFDLMTIFFIESITLYSSPEPIQIEIISSLVSKLKILFNDLGIDQKTINEAFKKASEGFKNECLLEEDS